MINRLEIQAKFYKLHLMLEAQGIENEEVKKWACWLMNNAFSKKLNWAPMMKHANKLYKELLLMSVK